MKRIIELAVISLFLAVISGCQQEQQTQTKASITNVSRQDRLLGYENLELKDALVKCQAEIEKQKKLLEDCQANYQSECEKKCQNEYKAEYQRQVQLMEEKYKTNFDKRCNEKYKQEKQQYEENSSWLTNSLPDDLLKQNEELAQENEELKQKIAQLQNAASVSVAVEPNKADSSTQN